MLVQKEMWMTLFPVFSAVLAVACLSPRFLPFFYLQSGHIHQSQCASKWIIFHKLFIQQYKNLSTFSVLIWWNKPHTHLLPFIDSVNKNRPTTNTNKAEACHINRNPWTVFSWWCVFFIRPHKQIIWHTPSLLCTWACITSTHIYHRQSLCCFDC